MSRLKVLKFLSDHPELGGRTLSIAMQVAAEFVAEGKLTAAAVSCLEKELPALQSMAREFSVEEFTEGVIVPIMAVANKIGAKRFLQDFARFLHETYGIELTAPP